tara:strand:- start:20150 stop:20917 length:768 start_codon:yes stop_codon:yes gene_type:complete
MKNRISEILNLNKNNIGFNKKEYAKGLQKGSELGYVILKNNKLLYGLNEKVLKTEINNEKSINFLLGVLDSGAKVNYYHANNLAPISLAEGKDYVLLDTVQQKIDVLNRVMPEAKVSKLNVLEFEPLMTQIKRIAGEDVSLSELEFDKTNNVYKIKDKEEYFYLSNYDAEKNILEYKLKNLFGDSSQFTMVPDLQFGNYSKTNESHKIKYSNQDIILTKLTSNTEEDSKYIYQNDYSKIPVIDLKITKKKTQKLK